jgi:hypothetical protein
MDAKRSQPRLEKVDEELKALGFSRLLCNRNTTLVSSAVALAK